MDTRSPMTTAAPLKLMALDNEDLAIISAHCQDAILRVGDILWTPSKKRLTIGMNRFAWEVAANGRRSRSFERRRSGLNFDRVLSVKATGIDRRSINRILELLAINYTPATEPAGEIRLIFAGGAEIALTVECIEAQLADLGGAWQTKAMPVHDLADQPGVARLPTAK
jgi:hypothetical protein